MKPFNLEQAKAGKPVQTRDGRAARIICFDAKDYNHETYIVALVTDKNDIEHTLSYDLTGKSAFIDDLMMVSEKKSGWVNIYPGEQTGKIHPSYDLAYLHRTNSAIATVQIEWEE